MIYEVNGKYMEGLEQDKLGVLRYFGRDFKTPGKRKTPAACEIMRKPGFLALNYSK